MESRRDILIRVLGRSDPNSSYPVDAELDDGSYFFGGELQIQETDLLKLSLNLPAYGAKLGEYLFSAPIQRALERAYGSIAGNGAGNGNGNGSAGNLAPHAPAVRKSPPHAAHRIFPLSARPGLIG